MLFNKLRRLHKHAAGAAGGVEHGAAVGLDDFHHQPHHGTRGKELPAALAFGQGELAQEVFIDLAEHIAGGIVRDIVELTQQIKGQQLGFLGASQPVILVLGQAALQLGLVLFDGLHRLFNGLGDVLVLGQVEQVAVAGVIGQVKAALGHGDFIQRLFPARTFELLVFLENGCFIAPVIDISKLEEDQPQYRRAVFRGLEVGVGA